MLSLSKLAIALGLASVSLVSQAAIAPHQLPENSVTQASAAAVVASVSTVPVAETKAVPLAASPFPVFEATVERSGHTILESKPVAFPHHCGETPVPKVAKSDKTYYLCVNDSLRKIDPSVAYRYSVTFASDANDTRADEKRFFVDVEPLGQPVVLASSETLGDVLTISSEMANHQPATGDENVSEFYSVILDPVVRDADGTLTIDVDIERSFAASAGHEVVSGKTGRDTSSLHIVETVHVTPGKPFTIRAGTTNITLTATPEKM